MSNIRLEEEIFQKRKVFKTDSYPMSIGEFANMYINDEVKINPDFQRNFRWTELQKSKLIESILLGIPIPPIFVYQNDNGIWEVVDGLQRLSTILQFMEVHKSEPNLELVGTDYLPNLKGIKWGINTDEDDIFVFTNKQKLDFKRSKINLSIILNDSDKDAKFDIFERLNTGGSFANPQEVRNSVMVMMNKSIFERFSTLSNNEDFLECLNINERLINEKYNMELALRFIGITHFDFDSKVHVSDYLDQISKKLCGYEEDDFSNIEEKFTKLFALLNKVSGENTFRRFKEDKYVGGFQESTFEFITIGVFENIDELSELNLLEKIQSVFINETFSKYTGSGSNIRTRVPKFLINAPTHFKVD
ncbi:hypothetical protein CXF72_09940 [Psychromonas sp. MB-3u-54]|uniref:DUF262 domain-containing protein n=1 Tax=Psychromonas sp. MB-3u-54 TaxID=2058319 RepID=UPI000C342BF6|nr:DUF262 domain-containing protein [Psychromonas sp. MB-3u-54]PKH02770.1 hypothetical protein CXF72_09940 [Psychromonas sp. MB-3u-54]